MTVDARACASSAAVGERRRSGHQRRLLPPQGPSVGGALSSESRRQTLAIAFMTVAELYEGALRGGWGEPRIARLNVEVRKYLVIPASPRVCWHWADIRAGRRAQPISVDDAWIAACARAHDWALVTHNPRDFDGIPELRVVTGEGPRDST